MRPHYKTVPIPHWQRGRELRTEATAAEQVLWQALRDQQLGVKFRRQHPFGPFFLDFYAAEIRLVVELDGNIHEREQLKARDVEREEFLRLRKRVVVRFRNNDVLESLDVVLNKLRVIIAELRVGPIPSPSPQAAFDPIPGPSPRDVEKGV